MTTPPQRYGMTIPFEVPLAEHRDRYRELVDLGYTDVWSSEADGTDAFTPLALAAAWAPELRLGCAIVPAFTRTPALMAQSVAALAEAAPGRVAFGIGSSSNVIVERWNGVPFEEPYKRTMEMVRYLRAAMAGGKVEGEWSTFGSKGFKLARPPRTTPEILVAGLRSGMLRMAGRESDGAIINWLSAEDVKQVVPEVQAGREASGREGAPEIVARIFVAPGAEPGAARGMGRYAVSAYLNVPVYAAFHEWLGRGDVLGPMWSKWKEGDRKGALDAIPDHVVDELIVHGPVEACRERLCEYHANGVTTSALAVLPFGISPAQAVKDLAPATWAR